MKMFCSKCGSEIREGDKFCDKCGAELIYNKGDKPDYLYDEIIDEHTDSAPAESVKKENELEAKRKTSSKIAGIILCVLLAVVAAALITVAAFSGCKSSAQDEAAVIDSGEGQTVVSDTVIGTDEEVPLLTTAAAQPDGAEETEKTEAVTTTTTASNAEAQAIRKLLLSKKWTTTLEGYNADIVFHDNGKADITVKVPVFGMTMKKTIEADYSLSDDCIFKIAAEYGGKTYGINGIATRESDSKLTVTRPNNAGTVTITAA